MQNSVKVLIGAVLAGTGGLAVWWQTQPAPGPEGVVGTFAEPTPAAGPAPAAEPATEAVVTEAPEPAAAAEFDVVRVSPDGQAVIAGRAAPGQTVEILLDGTVIGSVEADATGAFATVLDIPPSGEPRELALRTPLADDVEAVLALAPTADAGANEAAAAAISAFSASPFMAMGLPSKVVATAVEAPGMPSIIELIAPPYMAP